jgi:hypothetical protein
LELWRLILESWRFIPDHAGSSLESWRLTYSDKCHLQAMEVNPEANEGFQWNHVDSPRAIEARLESQRLTLVPRRLTLEVYSDGYEDP